MISRRTHPPIPRPPRDMKVCFLYNAQLHQIPHSLPIALELAAHHRDIEVDVAGVSERHLAFAQRLAQRYGLDAPVRYVKLRRPLIAHFNALIKGELAPNKKRTLFANLRYFSSCDAVVTPERTSLALRRNGLPARTRLIYTNHGAGDRTVVVAPEIREFDFVLVPGTKIERRRLELGLIRPGDYVSGIYAKFDWLRSKGPTAAPLFDNGRPTLLYSPHFDPEVSSWHEVGWKVLDWFAANTRYNLVFAPHIRLYEPPRPSKYRPFRAYMKHKHLLIDLGSERSLDMSYTLGADAYIGDVSSQVAEFLVRPRPCLFLNPRRTAWQGNANYQFWTLGPVLDDVTQLDEALQQMFATHADYVDAQRAYFEQSFDGADRAPSARLGADAIAAYLRR